MKQIICIKWGTKYGPEYVNRFYNMVARNITPPFRVICFTDQTEGMDPRIETRPLPEPDFVMPKNTPGKWPKSQLWGDLGDITGTVLFMDLDIIITDNIDAFFDYGDPSDTITAKNPNTPFERMAQTSIYRMQVGKLKPPRWPTEIFPVDAALVAEGKDLYRQRCASCHVELSRDDLKTRTGPDGKPLERMTPILAAQGETGLRALMHLARRQAETTGIDLGTLFDR